MAALGLRGKSLLALLLACLMAFGLAGLIGWRAIESVQARFGESYAGNLVQLNRERLFAPVSRELALAQRLAGSEVTRAWLKDENDPAKRALFFREAEGYRHAFSDHAYFVASAASLGYYLNSDGQSVQTEPRYVMKPEHETDRWFFRTISEPVDYQINVDYNAVTKDTKVWFNVIVRDGAQVLGVVGSGITLTGFLREFVSLDKVGVEPMVLDRFGSILVHPNPNLVTLNAESGGRSLQTSIYGFVDDETSDNRALRDVLAKSKAEPGEVQTLRVNTEEGPRLLAITWIPDLQWYVATAVDLSVAQVIEIRPLIPALLAFLSLLVMLAIAGAWVVERRVLKPLRQLRGSAQALAAGAFDAPLPTHRNDEIGELSTAFGTMARKIRSHTEELETRVRERTRALEEANVEMAAAHKKIDDSIDYASLIQHAILPSREMFSAMGHRHAVLWRPRDTVGGDFYVFRASEEAYLIGVVDCAGHGVPGALMTMLAHAAIEQAITEVGLSDPATVLARTDHIVRAMLLTEPGERAVATNMDVGLVYVDLASRRIVFSGAKVGLYYSDGQSTGQIAGARRALGDKRSGEYHNSEMPLADGTTFYLTTDGFLDQAGGEKGYGFGNSRFADMIARHARMPLDEQSEAFSNTLAQYQGAYPQRDDITMLFFRFDQE